MSTPTRRQRLRRTVDIGATLLLSFGALLLAPASPTSADIGFGQEPVAVIPPLAFGGVVPVEVQFDGSGSFCLEGCTLVAWEWSFGDGATSSDPVTSHVYTESGLFTVSLTVTSNQGEVDTATAQVLAFANTQAVISPSVTQGMAPLAVDFDGRGSVTNWDRTIVSYEWDFGDGDVATGPTVSHVFARPGITQVALTVTDSTGTSQTVGVHLRVQDPLVAPSAVAARSPRKGVVELRWSNHMAGVDRLAIERCMGSKCTDFTQVFVVPGDVTSFRDEGLRPGINYRYRVRVYDLLGNTIASPSVTIKVKAPIR